MLASWLGGCDADQVTSAITCSSGSYPEEVDWSLSCSDDTTLSGGGGPYTSSVPLAVALCATCTLDMTDSYGNGWTGAEWDAPGFGQSFSLASGPKQGTRSFVVQFQPPSPPPPPSPTPPPPSSPSPPLLPGVSRVNMQANTALGVYADKDMGPDDGTSELSFMPSSTTRQRVRFGAVPPQFLPMLLALSTGPAHADAVAEGNRSNGRALSAWVLLAATPVPPTRHRRLLDNVFTDKAKLRTALEAYDSNPDTAEDTYGAPNTWDVSGITDMSHLCNSLRNINVNISSWNTSGVTSMSYMFSVRALASNLQPRALPFKPLAPPPRPPPSRLPVHTLPRFMWSPCDSAARGGIQPAAEPRHVQRHRHDPHVFGARPRREPPAEPSLHAACTSTPRPPPSRPPGPHLALPCDSVGHVGVQPAAELRHVQRHRHDRHVLRACPRPPNLQPSPSFHAACTTTAPNALSPPGPHTSPCFMCHPYDSAVREGVQPAAELRHVQRHKHGRDVYGACSHPEPPAEPFPSCGLHHHHAHRPLASWPVPRLVSYAFPCESAGREGVQPAAELQRF